MTSPQAIRSFLESGCALIVASVNSDREPHASRGWAIDVIGANVLRLLVDANDEQLHTNLTSNGAVAVTATSVPTLRSVQLKGRAQRWSAGDGADTARMRRYCADFFADVKATDGVPTSLMERLVPASLAVWRVEIEAMFDQTPGPTAGAALTL